VVVGAGVGDPASEGRLVGDDGATVGADECREEAGEGVAVMEVVGTVEGTIEEVVSGEPLGDVPFVDAAGLSPVTARSAVSLASLVSQAVRAAAAAHAAAARATRGARRRA
jgi:hypothetical protein